MKEKRLPDRRVFFSPATGLLIAGWPDSKLPIFEEPVLLVGKNDAKGPSFENTCLEIVGATGNGMELLPNFESAMIKEVKRICSIDIQPMNMLGMERVDGCGLFPVFIRDQGKWKKYRLWNYLDDSPPDYPVTHA